VIRRAWQFRNIAGLAKYLKNIVMAGKIRKIVHCAPGNRKREGHRKPVTLRVVWKSLSGQVTIPGKLSPVKPIAIDLGK